MENNIPNSEQGIPEKATPIAEAITPEDTIPTAQPESPEASDADSATPIPITSDEGEQAPFSAPPKGIKRLVRTWWFWVIAVVVVIGIICGISAAVGSSGSSSGSSYSGGYSVSPFVTMVKTATNSNYGITYGAAFDRFFSSPKWSYFLASSGEHVVEFEGRFSYDSSPATATIQFVLDLSEGTMEVYHLSINGVAQNRLMLSAMVKKVFESY